MTPIHNTVAIAVLEIDRSNRWVGPKTLRRDPWPGIAPSVPGLPGVAPGAGMTPVAT